MRIARSLDGWCPHCPRQTYTWDSSAPYIRTCRSCGFIYTYHEENNMPVCLVCGGGYTSCACYLKPKLPKIGQTLRVVRKLEGGLIETLEGPVLGVAASPTGTLGSVTLGASGGYTRGVIVAKSQTMIEDATWEVVLLPEPPNKSVWVCPESSDRGKLAVWRRLDHQAAGSDSRWFYPGSLNGATWAQVCNVGAGYLLDPGAGPQND